jgi:endonuclease/exonuclease/phosphatase family metal-dependent hydrolase
VSASAWLVEVVNLPFPLVLTSNVDYVGWKWVAVTRIQFSPPLPADAQSESFMVRATSTTGVVTEFPVAFPINRGIQQDSCNTTVNVGIGNTWTWPFYGNGPRDPRAWSSATATGTGLPAGLSFAQGTGARAGHGVVTGTVQATALNGSVDLSYTQNASTTTKRYSFVVGLRAEPVRAAALSAVQVIQRGQPVLIQLPDGQGATGTYSWNMWANYQLPAGLSIVHTSDGWFVSGTVDSHARLEVRTVKLVLTSGGQSTLLSLTFDSRCAVTVYTQNTILFPEDIVNPPLDCLPAWAIFPGPVSYAICVAAFEILEEIFYNGSIHNTDEDNEDRADILVNYINAQQYDIVALQEVWDGPQTDAELDHIVQDTSASYRIVQGAGTEFDLVPPTFKINSGLLTLAKPVFNQPPTTDHVRVFDNAGGGSDSYSRKGFVATQKFVSDDPAEYLWVINTHAHAEEAGTRADQMQQIQDFITTTLGDTHPILLVGDLNIEADENGTLGPSSEYAAMRNTLAGFQDVALGRGLMTDDWYHNAYNHEWADEEHPAKRIDYIMVKPGTAYDLDFDFNDVDSIAIVNNDPLVYPGLCLGWALPTAIRCHYSDHFGLKATFRFRQR